MKMRLAFTYVFFLTMLSVSMLAHAQLDTAKALTDAQTLAAEKKYDKAMRLLKKAQAQNPEDAEINLALARTLSWKGDYKAAQAELDKLDAAQRNNPDVELVQANLYYYQGEFKKAEVLFLKILKDNPDYQDASEGLSGVRRAMAAPSAEIPYAWQIDTGLEISHFKRRSQKSWNQQFVQLSRILDGGKTVIHGTVIRYDQFANIDSEYEIGIDRVFNPRLSGYFTGAISPDALFRPDWRIAAGGAVRLNDPARGNWPVWFTLDTRRDTYAATHVQNITPGIRIEPHDGWAVSGRVITIMPRNEKRLHGQEIRLDGKINEIFSFNTGFADAPETEAGVTVNTKTIYGGIAVNIDAAHTVRLGYTRDDRENSYIRNMYNASISYRF